MAISRPALLQPPTLRRGLVCVVLALAACAPRPVSGPSAPVAPDEGWAGRVEAAVRAGDRAGCRTQFSGALVDTVCDGLLASQRDAVRVSVTDRGSVTAPARVRFVWRAGTDAHPAIHEVAARFRGSAQGTVLAELASPAPGPVPLWALAPSPVQADRGVTTIGPCAPETLERAVSARDTINASREQWLVGEWDGAVVVQCPPTPAAYASVLGAPFGSYQGLAAMAWPFGAGADAAVHVVMNPAVPLAGDGAALVLRHELVHVATRSYTWRTSWITEGLADAVAADPASRAASDDALRADVRDHGTPAALPTSQDFDASSPRLNLTYGYARRAVEVLRARIGAERARRVLTVWATDPTTPVEGVTVEQLTQWWQEDLRA